jgi:hypothetical protein
MFMYNLVMPDEVTRITLSIPSDLWEQFKTAARNEDRTPNNQLVRLIRVYLKDAPQPTTTDAPPQGKE